MDDELLSIEEKVGRNYESPPLHLWHPELSGDIDIRIDPDGRWFHEGAQIKRDSIVRLFASILRREEDGEYYLVTPGEKWRIVVEVLPLIVVDIARTESNQELPELVATLNTGKLVSIGKEHPIYLERKMQNIAAVQLPHGLAALFSRAAWYRLVDMAQYRNGVPSVSSRGIWFALENE